MAIRMQQRRGTSEQWSLYNPVLGEGEIGLETDGNRFKIGNGVDSWDDLSYFIDENSLGGSLDDYVPNNALGVSVATLDVNGQVPANQLGNATVDLSDYALSSEVTTAVNNAVSGLVDSAPGVLDTLNELANALGDNPEAIITLQSDVSALQTGKADTNSPTFTGLTDFQGIADFSDAVVVGIDALPNQTDNGGKYLTTDGSTASWQAVASPVPHPFVMMG
jgi:hypothetical protein